jgi:glycerate-2-kinase
MEEHAQKSFLQRIVDKKKLCPPWQGHKLTQGSNISKLKKWSTKLDGLFDYVLSELDPYRRVLKSISFDGKKVLCGGLEISLKDESKLIVVGAGKASHQMAKALKEIFGERANGLVAYHKDLGNLPALGNIRFQPSGHPNPDEGSIKGAQEIIRLLEDAGAHDIVFSLISGGGSAMMELPVSGVTLEDYIAVNELLNSAGFDIEEWNAARKHLSQVKGGRLAERAARAAHVFNLMVSDVKGDRLDVIASGPFVADPSTFEDAYRVLTLLKQKADALGKDIPPSVINYIKNNRGINERETLKTTPQNVVNLIIASNNTAIDLSAEQLASMRIYVPGSQRIHNLSGDIEDAVIDIYTHLVEVVNINPTEPAAIIAGGEATVDVTRYPGYKDGKSYGGRMQMMGALMLHLIEELPVVGLFAATDCRDGKAPGGMPESAGALIDGTTLKKSRTQGIDTERYIDACNTYKMHEKLSTQLYKDKFVTNVMDLVALVYLPMN